MAVPPDVKRVPLSRMRRTIARAMEASALVPQFSLEMAADLRPLLLRPHHASVSDVIVSAVARALRLNPMVNASFDGDSMVVYPDVNVGFAVAVHDGLLVPVIRAADELDLDRLADERARLVRRAFEGKLSLEDVTGGTFTISNLGKFGVSRFQALVVPPQAAILAVGAASSDGTLALVLSCDHRILDGAQAATFLGDVVRLTQAVESDEHGRSNPVTA